MTTTNTTAHTSLSTFDFAPAGFANDGITLRVIDREGAPWFVAADVCEALALKRDAHNGSLQNHMRALEGSEYTTQALPSASTTRKQYIISESGLYALILRSRKPEAQQFRKWVTSVVLPAIRKDGAYVMGEEKVVTGEMSEDALIAAALRALDAKAKRLTEENLKLTATVTEQAPKVEFHDAFMAAEGSVGAGDRYSRIEVSIHSH